MGEKDNSFQKQSGKNLTSLAQGGSGFKDKEFRKKKKKEMPVTNKKSI